MPPAGTRFLMLAAAVLALSAAPRAQPAPAAPAAPASTFVRAAWSTDDGLPQNTIGAIVQARDGYLWLGTLGGLVRFDGVRFTLFTSVTTPALPSNRIRALAEDREGRLWIGTESNGVTIYAGGRFEPLALNGKLPHRLVRAILPAATSGPRA